MWSQTAVLDKCRGGLSLRPAASVKVVPACGLRRETPLQKQPLCQGSHLRQGLKQRLRDYPGYEVGDSMQNSGENCIRMCQTCQFKNEIHNRYSENSIT